MTSPPRLWKISGAAKRAALIGLSLALAVAPALMLEPANAAGNGDISALTMRQYCRGVEAVTVRGDVLYTDTSKYPYADTCWGAFSTLHQESLLIEIGRHQRLRYCRVFV